MANTVNPGELAQPIDEPCPLCDGKGWVEDPSDGGTMVCPECDGEVLEGDPD